MLKKLAKNIPAIVRPYKLYKIGKYYLDSLGYFNDTPSDSAGNALPWFSYPAIFFLEGVIQKQWKVFEYGSGYSTVFWNRKCEKTVSVEHNEDWFNILRSRNREFEIHLVKEGADRRRQAVSDLISSFEAMNFALPLSPDQVHNRENGLLNVEFADYVAKVIDFQKGFFDVIVVDGMARSLCLFIAAKYISETGIIILDDAQRWQYNDAQNYLITEGFNRLDFHGLGPIDEYGWTTSVFFRKTDFLKQSKIIREKVAGDLGW